MGQFMPRVDDADTAPLGSYRASPGRGLTAGHVKHPYGQPRDGPWAEALDGLTLPALAEVVLATD